MGWSSKPPPGTLIDRSHPLANGLFILLPTWEGSGGKLWNVTGDGQAANLVNFTQGSTMGWTGGRAGGHALKLLRSSSTYVDLAAWKDKVSRTEFTCTFWVKPTYPTGVTGTLYEYVNLRLSSGSEMEIIDGDGTFGIGFRASYSGAANITATQLVRYTRHMLTVSVSTLKNAFKFYVDGNLVGTSTLGAFTDSAATLFYLGNNNFGEEFDGDMEYFMWHQRALFDNEVEQLYAAPFDIFQMPRVRKLYIAPSAAADVIPLYQLIGMGGSASYGLRP